MKKIIGPDRGSNPEPLAPEARIIPLDHQAAWSILGLIRIYFFRTYYLLNKNQIED